MTSRVAIHLAVRDAAPWLAGVLDAVAAQTHPDVAVTVWDNASSDATPDIVAAYPGIRYIHCDENIGFWAAQERLLADADADYVLALTDVVLDPEYVARCAAVMDGDATVGAVQGKLLQQSDPKRIDGLGFRIEPSRRVTILGHGEPDDGRWNGRREIFGVEGAAPMFRRMALEDCRIGGTVVDPDFRVGPLGYGDDLDIAWRLTLLGWKQYAEPAAVGWHDRMTTRSVGHGVADHVRRRTMRSGIPLTTRRLDWCNVRFAILKNDHILDILRCFPAVFVREASVLGYLALFEPRTLGGVGRFFRLAPAMLRRRNLVMARARRTAADMRRLFA